MAVERAAREGVGAFLDALVDGGVEVERHCVDVVDSVS